MLRLNVPGVVSRLIVPQIVPRILPVAGLGIVASFLRPALEDGRLVPVLPDRRQRGFRARCSTP